MGPGKRWHYVDAGGSAYTNYLSTGASRPNNFQFQLREPRNQHFYAVWRANDIRVVYHTQAERGARYRVHAPSAPTIRAGQRPVAHPNGSRSFTVWTTGTTGSGTRYRPNTNDRLLTSRALYAQYEFDPGEYNAPRGGYRPGTPFPTMRQAAIAFGKTYNAVSIRENREYGSVIYKRVSANPFNVWYYYEEPEIGPKGKYTVDLPARWGIRTNDVALIHTHGKYAKGFRVDDIGPDDAAYARAKKVPMYIVTPSGILFKYDPNANENYRGIIVSKSMPFDPNHPLRKNGVWTTSEPLRPIGERFPVGRW